VHHWLPFLIAIYMAPPPPAAEALGGYASGCLLRGERVPVAGAGYELIRLQRKRNWAHPKALAFLNRFGAKVLAADHLPVLVGDISQHGGGRMPSGHRSHQIGLDVDVWFGHPPPKSRGADAGFPSLVDRRSERIIPRVFSDDHAWLLRAAAEDPEVARIFVNWVIKGELCRRAEGDRGWLHKIRPWYGHDRHFHVRLSCPPGSPECRDQAAIPDGDGCGQETWFSRAEVRKRRKLAKKTKRARRKKKARPGLPARCKRTKRR
jgi:penicillin-insensitive murein DD-endopeptidase